MISIAKGDEVERSGVRNISREIEVDAELDLQEETDDNGKWFVPVDHLVSTMREECLSWSVTYPFPIIFNASRIPQQI